MRIRGCPVPTPILALLERGRWKDPGQEVWLRAVPWVTDPLDRLELFESIEDMRDESSALDTERPTWRIASGARAETWLDPTRAFFVAVNAIPGADLAVALDFRRSREEPRVIASVHRDHGFTPTELADGDPEDVFVWREIAPDVAAFVKLLGLAYPIVVPSTQPAGER